MAVTGPIGAHVSISGGLTRSIERAERIGAKCIQIFSSSPGQWKGPQYADEAIEKFRKAAKEKRIGPIFIHAKYLVNLVSLRRSIRAQSTRSLREELAFSHRIGADGVIVHLGSHQGRGYAAVKSTLVGAIQRVLTTTPSDTTLVIENSAGQRGKLSSSIDELADTVSAVGSERIRVCLDSCHLWAAGYDIGNAAELAKLVGALDASRLLDRSAVLHVNDSRDPRGSGRDRHQNLGDGTIGRKRLAAFVTQPKLVRLAKVIETPGFDGHGPDQRNVMILRELTRG